MYLLFGSFQIGVRLAEVYLNIFHLHTLTLITFIAYLFKLGGRMFSQLLHSVHWGTRWCSWLGHCATSRKVADSIPDGVTGIFH